MKIIKKLKKILKSLLPRPYINVTVEQISPNHLLDNKNIIVTGGGRGLGYYIAKKAISEGANVLITGRNTETLKNAAEELGNRCYWIPFDVTNIDEIDDFILKAENIFNGKIHGLVSNAGISLHEGNFRNVSDDGWIRQMDTNLKGNYFLVKAYVQYLEKLKDKKGNIVVITSERAKRADDIPYGLSKVATNSFIQGIASKVISEGIRINGVGPGVTASDMTGFERDGNLYAEWQPANRVFLPEEVAEVVNFLLCDVSNCITGEVITCDHGRYISHW